MLRAIKAQLFSHKAVFLTRTFCRLQQLAPKQELTGRVV